MSVFSGATSERIQRQMKQGIDMPYLLQTEYWRRKG